MYNTNHYCKGTGNKGLVSCYQGQQTPARKERTVGSTAREVEDLYLRVEGLDEPKPKPFACCLTGVVIVK